MRGSCWTSSRAPSPNMYCSATSPDWRSMRHDATADRAVRLVYSGPRSTVCRRLATVAASCGATSPPTHSSGACVATVCVAAGGAEQAAASRLPATSNRPTGQASGSTLLELRMPAHQSALFLQELVQPLETANCLLDCVGIELDRLHVERIAREVLTELRQVGVGRLV